MSERLLRAPGSLLGEENVHLNKVAREHCRRPKTCTPTMRLWVGDTSERLSQEGGPSLDGVKAGFSGPYRPSSRIRLKFGIEFKMGPPTFLAYGHDSWQYSPLDRDHL